MTHPDWCNPARGIFCGKRCYEEWERQKKYKCTGKTNCASSIHVGDCKVLLVNPSDWRDMA